MKDFIESILSEVRYKPKYKFTYDATENKIQLEGSVTNVLYGGPAKLQVRDHYQLKHYTVHEILTRCRKVARKFELHEVDEYLVFKGKSWVNPHPELPNFYKEELPA